MKELVTVIIPTYNRAKLVRKAIDSVLKQTYTNFEVLVIDDHSTDNTKEIIESFDDDRIKYLLNERKKGAQGARNTGLLNAKGEWIAFLDSDDLWLKEKLQVQLSELASTKKYFCFSHWYELKNDKTYLKTRKLSIDNTSIYRENYIGTFSTVMLHSRIIDEIGLLDENLSACQDWDYWIRIIDNYNALYISEPLIKYRIHGSDRISNEFENRALGREMILKKYYSQIEKRNYTHHYYYKLAIYTGNASYLYKALKCKFNVVYIIKYIYYKLA